MSSDVAGSVSYVYSVHVYPQSRDLNQIVYFEQLYMVLRAGLWVSVDSIKNRKQLQARRSQHSIATSRSVSTADGGFRAA
jgi:hypothetical protein